MKHNLYYLFIFLFIISQCFSQQKCFTILDATNSSKILYANIWKNEKIYTNSNNKGEFCIETIDLNNKFTISHIGYKTKKISLESNLIYLEKESIQLDEIVILAPKKKQKINLGKARSSDIFLTATSEIKIAEIGKIFKLSENKQFYLKKIKFKTLSYKEGRTVGLKIYSLNENDEPDQLLSTENIVLTLKKGTNISFYDFEDNTFAVPEKGFIVAMHFFLVKENRQYGISNKEWFFYDPSIGAEKDVIEGFYLSQTEKDIWKKHPNYDLSIEVQLTD